MRAAACLFVALAFSARVAAQAVDESRDFGVAPSAELRIEGHASPTPLEIPGAKVVTTLELRHLLQLPVEERPLVFDVLSDEHATVPGAIWLPGAGLGKGFGDELQSRLGTFLSFLSAGKTDRMLVFLCTGPRCWLSYNAALRAVRLGYTNVRWYRGGIEAWGAGGGALRPPNVQWGRGAG